MFRISKFKDDKSDYIEIFNSNKSSYSKIYLNQGASLQELILDNHHLIQDMSPLKYKDTYASSILFPFANRVKDGRYWFENTMYQLDINEKTLNNALHGLVYNKTFDVVNETVTNDLAIIKLVYNETNESNGFPFSYSIYIDYKLSQSNLEITLCVKNTDKKTFPFTLGWHPYFVCDDLKNSVMIFDSNKKTKKDSKNITTGIIESDIIKPFKINEQELDDCYLLNSNIINFKTSKYLLSLKSSEEDGFLQIYTPPRKNTIAIEPTTGVSDSFNNGIGLKTLKPNESYSVDWVIKIENIKS